MNIFLKKIGDTSPILKKTQLKRHRSEWSTFNIILDAFEDASPKTERHFSISA